MLAGDGHLQRRVDRRDEVAELVHEAREGAADFRRGQLIEMRRHHAPGTLHGHLHKEGGYGDGGEICSMRPWVQSHQREQAGSDDGVTAAYPLAENAEQEATKNGADVKDQSDIGNLGMGEMQLLGEE